MALQNFSATLATTPTQNNTLILTIAGQVFNDSNVLLADYTGSNAKQLSLGGIFLALSADQQQTVIDNLDPSAILNMLAGYTG